MPQFLCLFPMMQRCRAGRSWHHDEPYGVYNFVEVTWCINAAHVDYCIMIRVHQNTKLPLRLKPLTHDIHYGYLPECCTCGFRVRGWGWCAYRQSALFVQPTKRWLPQQAADHEDWYTSLHCLIKHFFCLLVAYSTAMLASAEKYDLYWLVQKLKL